MKKRKIHGRDLATLCVLFVMAVYFCCNLRLTKTPLKHAVKGEITFGEFTKEVGDAYTSEKFLGKTPFVTVNGLFARAIGQRVCNDVVLLENGMLSLVRERYSMTRQANAIAGLAEDLEQEGIPFLYVQAPYKEDPEDALYPVGVASYANENTDELLEKLQAEQVEILDLRPYLNADVELIEKYYFRTDHHWNFAGAFVAYQQIATRIAELFPDKEVDLTYTQWEQWESHTLENWFLGSRGKRVGPLFAGVDDLTWYTPKFETRMSCAVPKYGNVFTGDFTEANLRTNYLERRNFFKDSAYCLYIGGDYPLVQHRNELPVSDLKLLIVKDSYATPVQAYLSTLFAEIDVIDPRHFTESSVAEYARQTEPDLVLLMMNPSVFGVKEYVEFGEK